MTPLLAALSEVAEGDAGGLLGAGEFAGFDLGAGLFDEGAGAVAAGTIAEAPLFVLADALERGFKIGHRRHLRGGRSSCACR